MPCNLIKCGIERPAISSVTLSDTKRIEFEARACLRQNRLRSFNATYDRICAKQHRYVYALRSPNFPLDVSVAKRTTENPEAADAASSSWKLEDNSKD